MPRKPYNSQEMMDALDATDEDAFELGGLFGNPKAEDTQPEEEQPAPPAPPAEDEQPAEVEKPEQEQVREEEQSETPPWADRLATNLTELRARQDHLAQMYAQRNAEAPQEKPAPAEERQPTRYLTDVDLEALSAQYAEATRRLQAFATVAESQERMSFRQAEDRLLQKYPDLDEFIPAERRQAVLEHQLKTQSFGADWFKETEKAYKELAFDRIYERSNQLKSELDQLAVKREQKKEKEQAIKAASAVPAGGNVYQAPAEKRPARDARYEYAKKQMAADLKALGG